MNNTSIQAELEAELNRRAAIGQYPITLKELKAKLSEIGYYLVSDNFGKIDESFFRYISGDFAGERYPVYICGIIAEIDTGFSFAHYKSRRDDNFLTLQKYRNGKKPLFCVIRGRILSI